MEVKSFSMLLFRITSAMTLRKRTQPNQAKLTDSRLAEGEGGGRDEESYSRRAGTRCRLGSPGRRGAEELPPGSAVPHPPHRGRSPSSGCRFCDISGELAPMPDRRRPAGRNLTRAPRRTDGQATTNRK
jgi:hypothetical protein